MTHISSSHYQKHPNTQIVVVTALKPLKVERHVVIGWRGCRHEDIAIRIVNCAYIGRAHVGWEGERGGGKEWVCDFLWKLEVRDKWREREREKERKRKMIQKCIAFSYIRTSIQIPRDVMGEGGKDRPIWPWMDGMRSNTQRKTVSKRKENENEENMEKYRKEIWIGKRKMYQKSKTHTIGRRKLRRIVIRLKIVHSYPIARRHNLHILIPSRQRKNKRQKCQEW